MPEQLSCKYLELMRWLYLTDNLLTFSDIFEKQSDYNFPSSSFVS